MDTEPSDDLLSFSNETIKGRGCWLGKAVSVLMALAGIAFIVMPFLMGWFHRARPPGDRANAVLSLVFGAFFLVGGYAAWSVVRQWTIDCEGIECRDANGRHARLPWREVERVRWDNHEVRFVGRCDQVRLPWGVIPADRRAEAIGRIADCLPDFDLPTRPGWGSVTLEALVAAWYLLSMYLSFRAVQWAGLALVPMARQWHWDRTVFSYTLFAIFGCLWVVLLFPVNVIASRRL